MGWVAMSRTTLQLTSWNVNRGYGRENARYEWPATKRSVLALLALPQHVPCVALQLVSE